MAERLLTLPDPLITISPYNPCSIGAITGTFGIPASSAWPSANRAIFVPFRIPGPITVINGWWFNGSTVSASYHLDVGVYDEYGTKLISSGSTAQGTASVLQTIALTSTQFGPGLFYLALACDSATATLYRNTLSISYMQLLGMAQMASAFALPATATFATVASSYIPVFGISSRSVV